MLIFADTNLIDGIMKRHTLALIACLLLALPLRAENLTLAGIWNFKMDPENKGIQEQWFARDITGDTMELPGSMPERLKGYDITLTTPWTGSIYDSSYYYNARLEKYRRPGNIKIPFMLTPEKHYVGAAWYQRKITVPADWKKQRITLYLERVHMESHLWVDGVDAGTCNSLGMPHVFDLTQLLTPGEHVLTLRIDNDMSRIVDVGLNSHSVTDQTQGNWNGVVGKMLLSSTPETYIDEVQVYPDLAGRKATVRITIGNLAGRKVSGNIELKAQSFNAERFHIVQPLTQPFSVTDSLETVTVELPMGDFLTWDEFSPALYRMSVTLDMKGGSDVRNVHFGMREFTIEGTRFRINGREVSLRGTVENCVFPLTGYAPMDVAEWKRVFTIAKSYGLNHFRFHSYCPPEAAFIAADLVGFYLQPEGPSWANKSTSLGSGRPVDQYIMDESLRMERYFGNHASYCMLTSGNEPSGGVQYMTNFVRFWKERDPRRVYCGASVGGSWPWQIGNQYHVRAGVRGLDWGRKPESNSDWSRQIDTLSIPFVTHEMGQWCVFPDFKEIEKYTGVMKARNFELFQEDLADQHMGDQAEQFLMASGKLQALCYKHEIEKSMRTAGYAGFQLLCLNDYSGQGSAIVGVTNAFWDPKDYITPEAWHRFCSETVPLLRTSGFVYTNADTFTGEAEMYHFGAAPIADAVLHWRLTDSYGKTLTEGVFDKVTIPIGNCFKIGGIRIPLADLPVPARYNVEIWLPGTEVINDWDIWVYPAQVPAIEKADEEIYFCNEIDAKAEEVLKKGGKVFLHAAGRIVYGEDVKQQMTPVFWNTSWFKMRAPHTTGILVQQNHPAFRDFPTEYYSDIHWWELVQNAQCMLLSDFPEDFRPLVQPIDTWFVNRRLGLIFEARVGEGRIIVTSADLQRNLDSRPVARQMLYSLTRYMLSDDFKPAGSVTIENIKDLYTKQGTYVNTYTKSSPDELRSPATQGARPARPQGGMQGFPQGFPGMFRPGAQGGQPQAAPAR